MESPKLTKQGQDQFIELEGESYRILSNTPPRLLLEKDGEIRSFFYSADHGDRKGSWLGYQGLSTFIEQKSKGLDGGSGHEDDAGTHLCSPMPGKVVSILVKPGDNVAKGDKLVLVEAMKMENPVRAAIEAEVKSIHVQVGDSIGAGDLLVELELKSD